jgi:hypothetical protein
MKKVPKTFFTRKRLLAFSAMMIGAFLFMSLFVSSNKVSANHPVLVEGNCESPTPGTVAVTPGGGICGDYDGDGRLGTDEDTDGADRIFGTLRAALGPGTGAAAGTGANFNGNITIVTSGRFPERLFIGDVGIVPGEGSGTPGNVTIQAAPGVEALIDAVLQGDPGGNNNARQADNGITVAYNDPGRRVILRNLTIRNWSTGLYATINSHVTVDNVRFENNLDQGILAAGFARVFVWRSGVNATGYRIGTAATNTPAPGHAISYTGASSGEIAQTQISGNFGAAISDTSSGAVTYYEVFLGANGGGIVGATRNNTP